MPNHSNQSGDSAYRRDGRDEKSSGGYNRDDRGRSGAYNRDDRSRSGGYNRDDRGRSGGYNRDDRGRSGGYNRDDRGGNSSSNRDDRSRSGGYNRDDRGRGGGYNRDDRGKSGGYNRDSRGKSGGYTRAPRKPSSPIKIEASLFLLPEHPLTQDFQRAIGMAKGTLVEVDTRKKRGLIEIDGFKYKFEDERRKNLQKKYPIEKFLEREIQFAFWPTYSQKAAKYRKIDESPTIKISNLRQTLPEANHVEIIGQVLMVEEELFVMSIFSASQKKKYMVTIMGKFEGNSGSFIQMLGFLKDGCIHYKSYNLVLDKTEVAST